MERKTMMGIAAVGAVVVLLYMRSRGASAATAGAGGVLTSNSSWLNSAMGNASSGWGEKPVQIIVNTKQPTPVDDVAKSPPPAPAPAPAPAPIYDDGFSVGGGTAGKRSTATASPVDMNNPWVQLANGQYSGNK